MGENSGTKSAAEALSAIASGSTPDVTNTVPVSQPQITKQKRKRNRAILSCQPCHERKQQCNRTKPCSRCVARGLRNECIYFDQPSHKPSRIRVSKDDEYCPDDQLERILQSTMSNMEPTTLVGLEALLQLVQASSAVAGAPAPRSAGGVGRNLMADHGVEIAAAALGQLAQKTPSSASTPTGPMAEILQHMRVEHTQRPSGLANLADLQTHFPNHAITGHLLYHFFEHSSIPWLWAIIHKPIFDSCYVTFSSGPHPPSLDFIALLAMVCASSLQFLPETLADHSLFFDYEPGREVLQKRLYEFSRSVLYDDTPFPSLERIQALLMLAIYQLNAGDLAGYYNSSTASIRMGQILSMNRDASITWKLSPREAEIRRRIWWTLFIADRYQCLFLRRPYIIHEQHCDVMVPHNVDQLEIQETTGIHSKPLSDPTEHTFHILQVHWAKLIGKIWDTCFAAQVPSYHMVFILEEDIRRFELELPSPFRSQALQSTMKRPYIFFQSRILTLQIYHARAILWRPFLLIRSTQEFIAGHDAKSINIHGHARHICIVFCKRLLAWQLIIQSQIDCFQLRWADIVVRIFDAALTLAVAIISEPTSNQNEELDEWIALAQNLLRDMGSSNVLAPKAIQYLDDIRKRTNPTSHLEFSDSNTPAPSVAASHYLQKATQTIAQPQPSIMSDLFDMRSGTAPQWGSEKVAVYSVHFPGMELLCGDTDTELLMRFMDSCVMSANC